MIRMKVQNDIKKLINVNYLLNILLSKFELFNIVHIGKQFKRRLSGNQNTSKGDNPVLNISYPTSKEVLLKERKEKST